MHTRWDPVIKRGGLGSNYQEGVPLIGLTPPHILHVPI